MTVFALNRHAIIALALTAAFIPSASFAASCVEGPAKMSDSDIQAFLASPDGLLSSNVSGGLNLSNTIRQLVASDSGSLDAVIKLVSSANKSQASAIAGGLARAVQACKTVDPAYADKIQQSVATIQDTSFLEAFASASSQIATASLGQGVTGLAVGGGSTQTSTSQTGGTNGSGSGSNSPSTFAISNFSFSSGTSGQFVSSPTN